MKGAAEREPAGRPSGWPGGPAPRRAGEGAAPRGPVTATTSVLNPLSCIQQSVQLTFQEDMEIWKF